MTEKVSVPEPVYNAAVHVSEERDISIKAAFSVVFDEAGYDVR